MNHVVFLLALVLSCPVPGRKNTIGLNLGLGLLFAFLALRYGYGNDYMAYLDIHRALTAGLPSHGQRDLLFAYLNLLIPSFPWFVAVTSFMYILAIGHLIKSNLAPGDYWFGILVLLLNPYLFLVHLSAMRQTLAICIFIVAVDFAVRRRMLAYCLLVIIAAGFHRSALILLPFYFVLNQSRITRGGVVVICLLIGVLIATPIFDMILAKCIERFPQYGIYIQQGLQNSLRSTVISSFFFFVVLLNQKRLVGREMVYGKLSLIGTSLSLLAIRLSMITRIGMYFEVFMIVTLPQVFARMKNRVYRRALFLIMLLILVGRYVSFFANPLWNEAYSSYRTLFSR